MKLDTNAVLTKRTPKTSVDIRPLTTLGDFKACVTLQRRTWGEDFGEVVPASILKISARLGGVVAGAFDRSGALVGFVFGLTGVEGDAIVHWSHMLGVLPEFQNQGIGRALKEYQRAAVATVGARTIYWTFDPLVARNAHLNINVLGVRAVTYAEDMYGESVSPLHRGIGTDRLIVSWPVDDGELARRLREVDEARRMERIGTVHIQIPADIGALQRSDMAGAQAWRQRTREEFQYAFARGFAIQGFRISEDKTGWYSLSR